MLISSRGGTGVYVPPHQSACVCVCLDLHHAVAPWRCHPTAGGPIWSSLVWGPLCHSLPCKRHSVLSKHISRALISQASTLVPARTLSPSLQHISFIFPSLTEGWIPVFNQITSPPVLLCLSCHQISMRATSQGTCVNRHLHHC